MKTAAIITLTLLTSCTKDWRCEITTTTVSGTYVYEVDFRGDNQEKDEYEAAGTQNTMGNDMVTECFID